MRCYVVPGAAAWGPFRGRGAEGGAKIAPRAAGRRAGAARAVSVRAVEAPEPALGVGRGGRREPVWGSSNTVTCGPGVSGGARSGRPRLRRIVALLAGPPACFAAFLAGASSPFLTPQRAWPLLPDCSPCSASAFSEPAPTPLVSFSLSWLLTLANS